MKLANKIEWQLKNLAFKGIHLKNGIDPSKYNHRDNIIVFGTGRSGTTWLAELLSSCRNAIFIDEPLKLSDSKRVQKIGFSSWGQYIPKEDSSWNEAKLFFDRLFTGREFNPNHVSNSLFELLKAEIWVIKFIRAHLLMPYIVDNYNIRKPIFIYRNPYAVINSQMKHGGWGYGKDVKMNGVIIPKFNFHDDFYSQYEERFLKIRRIEELFALRWAIENKFVMEHDYNNKSWTTVQYENLLLNPEVEIPRIFNELKLDIPQEISEKISKPSKSSHPAYFIKNPVEQSIKWEKELTQEQKDIIEEVLKEFAFLDFL